MTLHDRICAMQPMNTRHESLFEKGYRAGNIDAAALAKEADELMAEMGNALASIDPDDLPRRLKGRVAIAINHYNAWKEPAK